MTIVILIPCSGRKRTNGNETYDPSVSASRLLSPTSGQALLRARADLSQLLHLPPGLDLGANARASVIYMDAYQRYDGNLYRRAQLTESDELGRVLIVSALYGLLTARERIRCYDLAMCDRLPNGRKVFDWWRDRKLGVFVHEVIGNLGATTLHDLLSQKYRRALSPWPPSLVQAICDCHNYPGRGSGSNFDRGDDLRHLLENG